MMNKQLKTLKELKAQLDLFLDYALDTNPGDEYFDITIKVMDKEYTLSNNADLYSTFYSFVENNIKMEEE